mmetsp:Transcript_38814/g.51148  ORF Transcript_38814/g.51148 Transcript_38814/m.51148 type:complete len:447 (+) Transcript_38814:52-1392(+)
MKGGRNLQVTPSTGNGLYAQPQKNMQSGGRFQGPQPAEYEEPLPLIRHTEEKAKDSVIEMLTDKCTKLQTQLEKAKALRSALHEQVENLTLNHDEAFEEFQERETKLKEENDGKEASIKTLKEEIEKLQVRVEAAEASLEPTQASIATLKEKLATERHKRELAEMTLGRERRQFSALKDQQDQKIREMESLSRPSTSHGRPGTSHSRRGEQDLSSDPQVGELKQRCAELEALMQERDEKIEDLMMDLETEREWRMAAQEEKSAIHEDMESLKEQHQQLMDHAGKEQDLQAGKEEELNQLRDLVTSLQAARQTDQERLDQMKKKSRNSQAKAKMEVTKEKDQKIRELEAKLNDAESKYAELRINSNERVKKYKARVEELRKRIPKTDSHFRPGSREKSYSSNPANKNSNLQHTVDQFPSPASSMSGHTKQMGKSFAEDSDIPEWMRY